MSVQDHIAPKRCGGSGEATNRGFGVQEKEERAVRSGSYSA